jgi:hypothetical protein
MRRLPDRAYVSVTEAVTWIVDRNCRDDDIVTAQADEASRKSKLLWWAHDGPGHLIPHLELMARGETWDLANLSENSCLLTQGAFDRAQQWLRKSGLTVETALAAAKEDMAARGQLTSRYDRCYRLLFDGCARKRYHLLGYLQTDANRRQHVEPQEITWKYFVPPLFLRDAPSHGTSSVVHTMGRDIHGEFGTLWPYVPSDKNDDPRPTYHSVIMSRDDALELKRVFGGQVEPKLATPLKYPRKRINKRASLSKAAQPKLSQSFEKIRAASKAEAKESGSALWLLKPGERNKRLAERMVLMGLKKAEIPHSRTFRKYFNEGPGKTEKSG